MLVHTADAVLRHSYSNRGKQPWRKFKLRGLKGLPKVTLLVHSMALLSHLCLWNENVGIGDDLSVSFNVMRNKISCFEKMANSLTFLDTS